MIDFNADDIVDGILQHVAGMEITDHGAIVAVSVDTTLRYVLNWLHGQEDDVEAFRAAQMLEEEIEAW